MAFTEWISLALAVTAGMITRDFIMSLIVGVQTKHAAEKRAKELDKYYQALLDAEQAPADADAS